MMRLRRRRRAAAVSPEPLPERESAQPPRKRRRSAYARRLILLAVTGVSLYVVLPTLVEVIGSAPRLARIRPAWFAVLALLEAGSVVCMVEVQRIAFRVRVWLPILTSQLAGAAFGRVVPGGAAAAGAMQYGMLVRAGIPAPVVASGLTASSLLIFGALVALPLLALPGVLAGTIVPGDLGRVLWLGVGLFAFLAVAGAVVITQDGVVRWAGRAVQRARNRLLRRRPPMTGLPERLAAERRMILSVLGDRWWRALLATVGRWLLDYLALYAALAAVGAHPPPSLVLLAYCTSQILGQIPATPGGLGFVEAGLTATLALAGVSAADAVLATLAYRLFAYWLYLPAGALAAVVHARRYGRGTPAADLAPS
jgi:uncharacterized protein (TIRG00374 family)